MKGFKLDERGDVLLAGGAIQYAQDNDLLQQTVRLVMSTNRGEWFLNRAEGIDFKAILTKNPNYDLIRNDMQLALLGVDDTFVMTTFEPALTGRRLTLRFEASNAAGRQISGENTYG